MANKWMALLGLGMLAAQAHGTETKAVMSEQDMVSYGLGLFMGKNFKKDSIDVAPQVLLRGLQDGLAGESKIPEPALRKVMTSFQEETRRKVAARHQSAAAENQKKSAAFLAENMAKEGVVTLAGGLEYKVLKAGGGKKPTEADSVECLYRGTLMDGTEFDATEPGRPMTLKVAQLIPGWKEALQLMPAGSRWQLFVPPQLAYGTRGAGVDIGPNEALVFDLELVAVK
ncbi:MAG: FKBP-type peptidyl-prolyl cis-trans isomerase [Rhodocyclales bacterium]|nr:FKBP-type peptidyl-prolyl cis-trans isomerase [Rhodocyclales bacterium]